jgi:hypothetical protein
MEKKPRKKKVLNIDLDSKETVIETPTGLELPLNAKEMYEFIGNGNFRTLPKGSVWKINGELASKFIAKGYGNLK